MPVKFPEFKPLSLEQAAPFGNAYDIMASAIQKNMEAQKLKELMPYFAPQAQADLTKAQLVNKFYPQDITSQINLRGAQAGLAGSEADKIRFLLKNPQYISPEGMLISQAMGNSAANSGGGQHEQRGYQGTNDNLGYSSNAQGNNVDTINTENNYGNNTQQPEQNISYNPNAMAFNPPQLQSPTGNSQLDNMWYKKFGMSPVIQQKLDIAKEQALKYQNILDEKNKQFAGESYTANQSTMNAHKFLDALDRANVLQTGYLGSKTPAIRDAEQEMDTYGNAMVIAGAQLFDPGHAIHDSTVELQKQAKAGRHLNKDVAFDVAHGIISTNDHLRERQEYYALGKQLGLKPEILDAGWNAYETQRPYLDPDTKLPNDAYKGTWKEYLSPRFVNSFLEGKNYIPQNQNILTAMNWTKDDLKKIKDWAKKHGKDPKDFDKKHLYEAAKEEKTTLSGLKQGFVRMGAL